MILMNVVTFFDMYIRQHARSSEAEAFDNLAETAQRSIDNNEDDFEHHLDELKGRNFEILWRQDWFVIERFKYMANSPHLFADKDRFEELVHIGSRLMRHEEIQKLESLSPEEKMSPRFVPQEVIKQLRAVVVQMMSIPQISGIPDDNEMFKSEYINIVRRDGSLEGRD